MEEAINLARRARKAKMLELGLNMKQLRKWEKEQRRITRKEVR